MIKAIKIYYNPSSNIAVLTSLTVGITTCILREQVKELLDSGQVKHHPDTYLLLQGGMCSTSDTMESLKGKCDSPLTYPGVKIKHLTRGQTEGTRFPKLDECAHFHYENVDLGPIKVAIWDEKSEGAKTVILPSANGTNKQSKGFWFTVFVTSISKTWSIRRSYENFRMLDHQLHHCVYDRKYSQLLELPPDDFFENSENKEECVRSLLTEYLERFSQLAGNLINCGPVLNWLELDNRGNRLIVADEAAINTPAVAAAYVVKRYSAQANDEISFEVGDMVSVIDMPPPEESTWWRGKKGFEVGFFPCECVEVIGNKIPQTLKTPKVPTKPVLRKHGKLIAFFRSFLLSRPSRRKLKQTGILKERVFGCDLGEHLMNTGRDIPLVLKCCTEFIEEHGILDGIYRLSGVTSNIQKLRLAFDEDKIPDLNDEAILQDIHCMASLLKMYFRELPNPLLTYQLYDKFVAAVQADEDLRLLKLRDVVQQLPPPHYRTCEFLMKHLAKVAAHGNQTGMTPKNVAIVWAPNLLRSRDVEGGGVGALHVVGVQAILTEYLIRYVDLIFSDKIPTFPSPCLEDGSPKRIRPKSLAISTPTKLLSLEEARSRALSANLLPMQQKYIDVGGGPESLPEKYHTVIDLPISKHGGSKLKKSPSGWKSFLFRGWHSNSARGRKEIRPSNRNRKGGKIIKISPQRTNLALQEKAVTESDVSHITKLRTVKSAESLMSVGGGMSSCNSEILNSFSPHENKKFATTYQSSFDETMITGSENGQFSPFKSPSHLKHIRSMSHDSYFESGLGIPLEEDEMDEENPPFLLNSDDAESEPTKIKYRKLVNENDDETASLIAKSIPLFIDNEMTMCSLEIAESNDISLIDLENEPSLISTSTTDNKHYKIDECTLNYEKVSEASNIKTDVEDVNLEEETNNKITTEHINVEDVSLLECIAPVTTSENISSLAPLVTVSQTLVKQGVVTYRSPEEIQPYYSPLHVNHSLHYCRDTASKKDEKSADDEYGNEETVIVEIHAIQESSSEEENMVPQKSVNWYESGHEELMEGNGDSEDKSENGKGNISQCSTDVSDTQELLLNMSVEATISDTLSLSQLQSFELIESSAYSESAALEGTDNLQVLADGSVISTPESPTMGNVSDMPSSNDVSTGESFDRTNNSGESDKNSENLIVDNVSEDVSKTDKQNDNLMLMNGEIMNGRNIELPFDGLEMPTVDSSPTGENYLEEEETRSRCSFKDDQLNQALFSEADSSQLESKSMYEVEKGRNEEITIDSSIKQKLEAQLMDYSIMDKSDDFQIKLSEAIMNSKEKLQLSKSDKDGASMLFETNDENQCHISKSLENNRISQMQKENIAPKDIVKNTDSSSDNMNIMPIACEKFVTAENNYRALSDIIYSTVDVSKSPFSIRKHIGLEKLSPVSPVEESRRKFESEIGRTIVRDRKMKLEMEQIQAERQQRALQKQDSLVSPGEPSVCAKSHAKLRHHSSEEITCNKSAESKLSESIELRRSPGRHFNTLSFDKERKRGSDPQDILSRFKQDYYYSEPKRFSEPLSSHSRYIHVEKKSSVKELLSKFEPKCEKSYNTSQQQSKREFLENTSYKSKAQINSICHHKPLVNNAPLQLSLLKTQNETHTSVHSDPERQEVYHSLPDFSFQPSSAVQRSSSSTNVPSVVTSKTNILLSKCCPYDSQVPLVNKVVCSNAVLKSPIAIRPQSLNFERFTSSAIRESPLTPKGNNASISHVNINREINNSVLGQRDNIFRVRHIDIDQHCSYHQDYSTQIPRKESFQNLTKDKEEKLSLKNRIDRPDSLGSICSNIVEESYEVSTELAPSHIYSNLYSNTDNNLTTEQNHSVKAISHTEDIHRRKENLETISPCQISSVISGSSKSNEFCLSSTAENLSSNEEDICYLPKNLAVPVRTSKCSSVIHPSVQESKANAGSKITYDTINEKSDNVPKSRIDVLSCDEK